MGLAQGCAFGRIGEAERVSDAHGGTPIVTASPVRLAGRALTTNGFDAHWPTTFRYVKDCFLPMPVDAVKRVHFEETVT